ncbi:MAG: cobalamin-dependent protein [Anaerolineae bacterium]|nr:cobalamin-dependent protein [Anaerolineae bacterium]
MADGVRMGEGVQRTEVCVLSLLEAYGVSKLNRYRKGSVLYRQGDPARFLFVVKRGKVKISSISPEGKMKTYAILGEGHIVGDVTFLLGGEYESLGEALVNTDAYVITRAEFEHLLAHRPPFCRAVIHDLGDKVRLLARQVRDLTFIDVRQRLENVLLRLADEHGVDTEQGTRIELAITHQDIAEMIAANRSTVTTYLNELRREGFLRKDGRCLVLTPSRTMSALESLKEAVLAYDSRMAATWARKVIRGGSNPVRVMEALAEVVNQADEAYARGDLSLADANRAAVTIQSAILVMQDEIRIRRRERETLGTVVIGTVSGDLHGIGKTMVSTLLISGGFDVTDLGVSVSIEGFVEAIGKHKPDVLVMSSYLTTSLSEQKKVIDALKRANLRHGVKIVVGGGATTEDFAAGIGADAYGSTTRGMIWLVKGLLGKYEDSSVDARSIAIPPEQTQVRQSAA